MALINPIVGPDHWLSKVRRNPSSNYHDRKSAIALLVIHGISLPQGRFGTGFTEDLFCNRLDITAHPSFRSLEGSRVSTHLLISRWGKVTQFVPFDKSAWHAGQSSYGGRILCNDFSVGIELEGTDDREYTDRQYIQLMCVVKAILRAYPSIGIRSIVGHNEIAPGRKTDPGPLFDWLRLYRSLTRVQLS